ncbi:MAG: ATP-dependent zinc metalloprotease FtsH [Chitinophagaceae bacterium]
MEDKNPMQPENSNTPNPKKGPRFNLYWIYGLFVVILLFIQFGGRDFTRSAKEESFQTINSLYIQKNLVDSMVVFTKSVDVYLKKDSLKKPEYSALLKALRGNEKGPHFSFTIGDYNQFRDDIKEAEMNKPIDSRVKITYAEDARSGWLGFILQIILPIVIMVGLWVLIMRKMGGGGNSGGPGGIFNIGKSKAQLFEKGGTKVNITFSDVAGLDEAKVEVMEVVDFLKNPKKYTALGGKIPKGCLLVGPPGTGKTLLAKAMAGEAQVPFFSLSGSDFVEMFVGVGASRVRDLFKQAREKSPCIIFIDEIDAIGRARGKNQMMTNDERENTLNQLLVEMDGFGGDSGIIVLAATNRPDVLDAALLRPGRFDRQISIDIPDLSGREAIFKVHLKKLKTANDLDIHKLASQTPGFAGADIANVCNEAALIAARKGKTEVNLDDFNDAVDRIIGGLEKKNKIISPDEKKVIAYHEAGHAVSGWFLEYAYPLVKVTIVPRGEAALGYAQYLPKEKYLTLKEELEDRMAMALGGRVVEELVFGKISTGALSDLQQVTKMAYAMVTVYGMNDKLGNISFYDPQNEGSFQKPYAEETGRMIDEEVRKLSDGAYNRVKQLLTEKMEAVRIIAEALLEKEVLYKDDLERLIGKRPFVELAVIPHETNAIETPVDVELSQNTETPNAPEAPQA